ncbi:hypothetical protein Tco_1436965 [Tanacetum coccineum]
MSIIKEQQQALDSPLVPHEQRLRIGNYNYRLSTTFKPKEPTFHVALDVISLTPFYQAFLISVLVPVIYIHEFWATATFQKHCNKFKLNTKIILLIWKLLEICFRFVQKFLGMFHQKNVDYVYLLWEDLVFQIETKVSKRNKDMYYPRFTKVIINHFMSQDQSIPRRNKVDWHMAKDDLVLTIMRFIPQHEVVQKYGVILPDYLTNQSMKESEVYRTYYDLATGKVAPKPKYVRRSTRTKTDQAPQDAPGKRLKATAKVAKSGKKATCSRTGGSIRNSTISWKSSDEDDDEEVSISKDDDEDADDQVDDDQEYDGQYDEEERQDEEDKQEEVSDLRVQTPSHYESTDDQESDEETQGANVEGEEMDEEETNEEEEVNEP